MTLKVKSKAPAFTLPDQDGLEHSLKDYLGKWVLIYFYPKDDTPGCTKEACAIRDNFPAFKKLGIKVFGVSADSVKKHQKFAEKFDLPFTLLADEDKKVIKKYKVWGKKKFMPARNASRSDAGGGREYMGILRTSYLIDPKGKIKKVYEKVNPVTHAEDVLADIKVLSKN